MTERLVVVTPWFPTADQPYAGSFVRSWTEALRHPPEDTVVVHVENVLTEAGEPQRAASPLGDVVHVPVTVTPTMSRPEMARRQLAALRAAALPELATADVVHAHVGMPTAWAASQVLSPSTRFVVTEHASYTGKVLRDPEGRQMYREMAERADHLLTVSESTARLVRAAVPSARDHVTSIGNPVPSDAFPARATSPTALRRWVYVGNLIPTKGVERLVRAFAHWAGVVGGRASLTLVGQGSHETPLRVLAEELGVAHLVRFAGPVPHDRLHEVFADADLLVHLATFETFGLTVIEAAMSGLPVVVTTCSGPEETLADAAAEGLVQFVAVGDAVAPVISAVERLEGTLATANPGAVRADLVDRFGLGEFGDRARRFVLGADGPGADVPAPTVVAIAFSPRAARRTTNLLQAAIRAGARTVLVTNQPEALAETDPRTRLVDMHRTTSLDPMRGVELALLKAPTRAPLLAAEIVLRGLGRRAGGVARRLEPALRAVERAERGRQRLVRGVRSRITYPLYYAWTDPWRLGLAGIRWHAAEIERDGVDVIVHADEDAVPLAWRLARRFPDADVVGAVSGTALARLVARRIDTTSATGSSVS